MEKNPLFEVIDSLIAEGKTKDEINQIINFFSLGAPKQSLIDSARQYLINQLNTK